MGLNSRSEDLADDSVDGVLRCTTAAIEPDEASDGEPDAASRDGGSSRLASLGEETWLDGAVVLLEPCADDAAHL